MAQGTRHVSNLQAPNALLIRENVIPISVRDVLMDCMHRQADEGQGQCLVARTEDAMGIQPEKRASPQEHTLIRVIHHSCNEMSLDLKISRFRRHHGLPSDISVSNIPADALIRGMCDCPRKPRVEVIDATQTVRHMM
jgi:hypothetical protein